MKNFLSLRHQGYLLMVLATLCFPTMDVMAKFLTQSQPVLQVVWARYTGQFILILVIFLPRLSQIARTHHPRLQLARSASLFIATCCFFTSLRYIEQGLATAIFAVGPVIITVLAVMFLSEKIGMRRIFSVCAGFTGALIIIQPQSDTFTLIMCLPLIAATFFALYSILTRKLRSVESATTTLFFTAGFGAFISSLILPFIWVAPLSSFHVLLMCALAALAGIGHYGLILAHNRVEASDLAPLNYLALVFAMLWGGLIFAEVPTPATISGACLIVASGLYIWRREQIKSKERAV